MKRLLLVPYTFVLLNWAALAALYVYLRGRRRLDGVWAEPASRLPRPHGRLLRPLEP